MKLKDNTRAHYPPRYNKPKTKKVGTQGGTKSAAVSVRVLKEDLEQLNAIAARDASTVSLVIRKAVHWFLAQDVGAG